MPAKVRNPPKWKFAELHLPACGGCGIGCRTHRLVGSTRGLRCVPNLRGCNTTGGEAAGIPTDDWRLWNLDCRQIPARSVRPPGPAALQSQIHILKSAIPKSPQRRGMGSDQRCAKSAPAATRFNALKGGAWIRTAGGGFGGGSPRPRFNPLKGGAWVRTWIDGSARTVSSRFNPLKGGAWVGTWSVFAVKAMCWNRFNPLRGGARVGTGPKGNQGDPGPIGFQSPQRRGKGWDYLAKRPPTMICASFNPLKGGAWVRTGGPQ